MEEVRQLSQMAKAQGEEKAASQCTTNSVLVEVQDQGPGVPEEKAELVFAPFHTTKRDGMGMGLSICRSIILEHGGILNFRNNAHTMSNGVNAHGATFYFTLPIASEGAEDA